MEMHSVDRRDRMSFSCPALAFPLALAAPFAASARAAFATNASIDIPLISRLATSSTYSCTPWDAKLIC